MRKIMLAVALAITLGGCITAQQAKDMGMAAVDAACDNLPSVSVYFEQNYVQTGRINGTGVRVGRDALAVLGSTCSTRPVKDAASAMRTISGALAALAKAELMTQNGGGQ